MGVEAPEAAKAVQSVDEEATGVAEARDAAEAGDAGVQAVAAQGATEPGAASDEPTQAAEAAARRASGSGIMCTMCMHETNASERKVRSRTKAMREAERRAQSVLVPGHYTPVFARS